MQYTVNDRNVPYVAVVRKAILVADLVDYSQLITPDKTLINKELENLFTYLRQKYKVYVRQYKGDYIECYIPQKSDSLEIALLFKTKLKSLEIETPAKISKNFKEYGLQQAIGVGTLNTMDSEKGIIDGEAIYMAGRKINNKTTTSKERKIIKKSLFYLSKKNEENERMNAFFALIDTMINKASQKQSEIIFLKLKGMEEKEIAQYLDVNISVVNRQSNSVGWNAIKETITYYQNYFKKYTTS